MGFEDKIAEFIKIIMDSLINDGITYFITGGAIGFDTIAAETVLELRKIYKQIKLILFLPCTNQTTGWDEKDVKKYEKIKEMCDEYYYISTNCYKGCMFKRNRHLIDSSMYCISYLTKKKGGTYYTVNYGKKKGVKIYNIADMINSNLK